MSIKATTAIVLQNLSLLVGFLQFMHSLFNLSRFLDFCKEKGGYKGCRYSEDEVTKMREKMNQLTLMPSNDLTFDDDTPWLRKDE